MSVNRRLYLLNRQSRVDAEIRGLESCQLTSFVLDQENTLQKRTDLACKDGPFAGEQCLRSVGCPYIHCKLRPREVKIRGYCRCGAHNHTEDQPCKGGNWDYHDSKSECDV